MAPRSSIIPGAFVEDPRPRHLHFRILNLLGRHTDDEGWCRLKQQKMGAYLHNEDGTVVHRVTVNRIVKDLVEWGYVEKFETDANGRALWYRVIMDRPGGPPPRANGAFDVDDEACSETATAPDVAPFATSGVAIGGYSNNDLSLTTKTPQPHGACATGLSTNSALARKAAEHLVDLRADGAPSAPVEHLLRPIIEQRRFSSADKRAEMLALAREADGLPIAALRKAAELVLGLGVATIKAQRIRDAIAAVRVGGAMVVISRGSSRWRRWLEYFRSTDPRQAALMAKFETWQVPSEWPPAEIETDTNPGGSSSAHDRPVTEVRRHSCSMPS